MYMYFNFKYVLCFHCNLLSRMWVLVKALLPYDAMLFNHPKPVHTLYL